MQKYFDTTWLTEVGNLVTVAAYIDSHDTLVLNLQGADESFWMAAGDFRYRILTEEYIQVKE